MLVARSAGYAWRVYTWIDNGSQLRWDSGMDTLFLEVVRLVRRNFYHVYFPEANSTVTIPSEPPAACCRHSWSGWSPFTFPTFCDVGHARRITVKTRHPHRMSYNHHPSHQCFHFCGWQSFILSTTNISLQSTCHFLVTRHFQTGLLRVSGSRIQGQGALEDP